MSFDREPLDDMERGHLARLRLLQTRGLLSPEQEDYLRSLVAREDIKRATERCHMIGDDLDLDAMYEAGFGPDHAINRLVDALRAARAEIARLKAPVAVWEQRLGAALAEIARAPHEQAQREARAAAIEEALHVLPERAVNVYRGLIRGLAKPKARSCKLED